MVAVSFGSLGEASVEIRASLSKLSTDLNAARTQVSKSLKDVGANLQTVGRNLSTALTLPLTVFGTLSLKVAGDFEQAMNRVAAVSGATEEQLESLKEQARDLGATTQFSASQAADAMAFLAQAGFEANEIISVMPDTLKLAAAAQLEMGSAADIVSNIMAGFRIKNEDLSSAVDVLTKAFTSSNTDLVQLGEAMKFVGPVASAAGLSFEETAAAAGLLGNAGLQASLAGTALRGAISRILAPGEKASEIISDLGLSFVDANGRIKSLSDILVELEPHADDAGLFMELFGQRAGPAMAALVAQGSGALRELTTELENSGGTADRIASVQMEGLNGALRELKSAFEEVLIALGESGLLEFITGMARSFAELLRQIGQADPQLLKLATVIGGLALVIGPVLGTLGLLAAAIGALLSPIGLVVAAFAVGGTLLVAIATFGEDGLRLLQEFVSAVVSLFTGPFYGIVGTVQDAFNEVIGFFQSASDEIVGQSIVPDMVDDVLKEFDRLRAGTETAGKDITDTLTQSFSGASGAFTGMQNDFSAATTKSQSATERFGAQLTEFGKSVRGTSGPLTGMIGLTTQLGQAQKEQADNLASTISFIDSSFQSLFGDNKQFAIASALINTALAVTRALSSAPYPYNIALAAAVGALGAAQVATIAATEFAEGGIFDQPSTFDMGNRGIGVLAEAGPEAILPLARTPQGLGVSAAGLPSPDIDVQVVINNAPSTPTVRDDGSGRVDITFDEAVARQFRPGTTTSRALQDRFGLNFATRR